MAKAKHKINPSRREPNGRRQRPTVEILNEMNRSRDDAIMSVALAQPHRSGAKDQADPRLESPFGRFCVGWKLRREISVAADDFSALVRGWRAAKGVPSEIRIEGSGNGLGPSDEAVRAWGERIAKVEHAVIAKSDPRGYLALRVMVIDGNECDPRFGVLARMAAFWLAVEMGTLSPKETPFS
jgi:hypothetical protein